MTIVRSKALYLGVLLALGGAACDNEDDPIPDSAGSAGTGGRAGSNSSSSPTAAGGAGGKAAAGSGGKSAGGAGGAGGDAAPAYENAATSTVTDYINDELVKLKTAAEAIQKAAPEPDDNGWNAKDDAAAVADMKSAWKDARAAYEHIEGSIAVLFTQQDVDTDERYDGFIETDPDDNLFDDQGVIGVHAIERILWSDSIPARVVSFEEKLTGYVKAEFPKTRQQADDFKNKLAARLINDIGLMDLGQRALDSTSSFHGMIGSMGEQVEKTDLAARGEDESRYSQHTLADMRSNLIGARKVFEAFKPWAEAKTTSVPKIEERFDKIDAAYSALDGDALPPVPETFDPTDPSDADLATDYGKLWKLLSEESDSEKEGSLVQIMGQAADAMGIPGIVEED